MVYKTNWINHQLMEFIAIRHGDGHYFGGF